MVNPLFPDHTVVKYIEDLAQEFSLEEISIDHWITQYPDSSKLSNFETWTWNLNRSGSPVILHISICYPDYFISISLTNERHSQSPKNFLFKDYLSKELKATGDLSTIERVNYEKSWKKNWTELLDILKNHLRADLKDVLVGIIWPKVDFDIADYVEPEALDQIYRDQIKLIEHKTKAGRGWLSFLKLKRTKD